MKRIFARIKRFVWWTSLAVFLFCGTWIIYYLYTASIGQQALASITNKAAALRISTVHEKKASHESMKPNPVLIENTGASTDQTQILASSTLQPAPANQGGEYTIETEIAEAKEEAKEETKMDTDADPLLTYYNALHETNPDLIGWITIQDTVINYPVMYTPKDPQKYLHRDFEERYSFAGLPFLDARCDYEDRASNLILYAHNMRSGQMFAQVTQYLDPEYLAEHSTISFDTLNTRAEYEVIAVFQIDIKPLHHPAMLCYSSFTTTKQDAVAELNDYIATYASIQVGQVQLGDSIITLSTCKRAGSIDRLVVMARSPRD